MTKLLYSLNTIHHTSPLTGKQVEQAPNGVFQAQDSDVDFLVNTNAAREPTERELLAYKMANGILVERVAEPAPVAADPTPAAADPAPAPAAAAPDASGDPVI